MFDKVLAAAEGYGAHIVIYDKEKEKREEVAARYIEQHGYPLIPPFTMKKLWPVKDSSVGTH